MFGLFKKSKRPNIYPYLVPNGYLEHGGALIRTLIPNELHLMLVSDHGGAVLCINDSELAAWGMDKETALKTAQQNLDLELKSGKIGIAFHQGADNTPFIVFSGHWLAAASLFAPGLLDMAKGILGTRRCYACVPHRETLLLFPEIHGQTRAAFEQMILENCSDGDKPLTFRWLAVCDAGIAPLPDDAPAASFSLSVSEKDFSPM